MCTAYSDAGGRSRYRSKREFRSSQSKVRSDPDQKRFSLPPVKFSSRGLSTAAFIRAARSLKHARLAKRPYIRICLRRACANGRQKLSRPFWARPALGREVCDRIKAIARVLQYPLQAPLAPLVVDPVPKGSDYCC